MKKKALIFGVTGQDGSYLADFLLKKNYQVHGVTRRSSSINTVRIDHALLTEQGNWIGLEDQTGILDDEHFGLSPL